MPRRDAVTDGRARGNDDAAVYAAQAEALREAQAENSFLRQELAELQTALQRSERAVNLMFVKNIIERFMKEGDLENSLPAIAQALDFSAAEVSEIRASRGPGGQLGEIGRAFKLW